MRIVILEDELYNYRMLRQMLLNIDRNNEIVGPFTTVEYAREFFSMSSDIDLIIADIQLSDGLSFNALDAAPKDVPVIFTTAYDDHALRAFSYNSLSYLLKPIDEDELAEAISKARPLLHPIVMPPGDDKIYNNVSGGGAQWRERFVVNVSNGERIIPVSTIRYIASQNKTTYLCLLDGSSFAISKTIAETAAQLDPKAFMQVNRKFIVPAAQVDSLRKLENGREQLILRGDNSPEIIISREKIKEVKNWLDNNGIKKTH